jgi:hypothetical protein
VEPSGTNLALRSNDFTVTGTWTPNDTTIISTDNLSPDGTNNATRIRGASGANQVRQQVIVGTSGAVYVGSVWIRRVSGTSAFLLRVANAVAGSVLSISPTTTWQRYSFSSTATSTTVRLGFVFPNDTDEFEIWGAQLETGSVATSYIPTTTAAVTRNADVVSVSGAVSGSIGQTVGTIYCEFAYFGTPAVRSGPVFLRQADLRGLSINFASTDSPAGIRFSSRNNAGETALNIVSGALQIGTYYKIAIAYDAGGTAAGGSQASGVVAYVNGVQAAIGTFRVPDAAGLTQFWMYAANSGSSNDPFNGRIRAAALYTTRLSNAELALITQP